MFHLQKVAAGQIVPERAGVPRVETAAVPGLRREEYQDPEHQRHQQALDPLPCVLAGRPLAQSEVGGAAGQEEQQLHVPHADEVDDPVGGAERREAFT